LEVGYPNCPLTVSFLGDYGPDTKKSSNHTSAPNPNNIFSAYQNQNDNQTENTSNTQSSAQVIFLNHVNQSSIYKQITIFFRHFWIMKQ